jgi:hypothetical protein
MLELIAEETMALPVENFRGLLRAFGTEGGRHGHVGSYSFSMTYSVHSGIMGM